MIHIDELPLLTQNKSAADICLLYEDMEDKRTIFRESCRNFLSRFLMDNDEKHPYECNIVLEQPNGFGLFALASLHLVKMWQEDGIVFFNTEEFYDEEEFDSMRDDELMTIIEEISK